MDYANSSMQELVEECITRGVLVTPEMLDRDLLIRTLTARHHAVQVNRNYTKPARKRTVQDFVRYFNARYKALSAILKQRKELENVVSIARVRSKRERETVTLIGMVLDKRVTKNGNVIVMLEDPTGIAEVWLSVKSPELIRISQEIVLDEVIGIVGMAGNGRIFANSVHFPDTPFSKELKKGPKDVYVAFVGDVEVGSKLFMKESFEQFLLWLAGGLGTEDQREVARKVGYAVFIGDLVHGVGVYPGQEHDSDITDIKEQYAVFTRYIKMIPEHIQVILIPGNHDAGRLQEPQLPIYADFAPELFSMPNVHVLSNPSTVTIEKTDAHGGFDLLLYHGYSLVYYSQEVQPVKDAGGMKAMEEVMKLYLRKRHLAPTHGSNTYVPDPDEDPLVIDKVPDFLVTGHVHNVAIGQYNGVQLINAGCWNDVSDEQIKRGLEPEPAKLPLVNLRTRDIKLMDFYPRKEAAK